MRPVRFSLLGVYLLAALCVFAGAGGPAAREAGSAERISDRCNTLEDLKVDGNTTFDRGTDALLRDWTDDGTLSDTPPGPTRYGLAVRCATNTACSSTSIVPVDVACPSSGTLATVSNSTTLLHRAPINRRQIRLDGTFAGGGKDAAVYWSTGVTVDAVRGSLGSPRYAGFGGEVCLIDNYTGAPSSWVDSAAPLSSGQGV